MLYSSGLSWITPNKARDRVVDLEFRINDYKDRKGDVHVPDFIDRAQEQCARDFLAWYAMATTGGLIGAVLSAFCLWGEMYVVGSVGFATSLLGWFFCARTASFEFKEVVATVIVHDQTSPAEPHDPWWRLWPFAGLAGNKSLKLKRSAESRLRWGAK